MSDSPSKCEPVRSFVRRIGRITVAQREALDTLLPSYTLSSAAAGQLDLAQIFGRKAPVWLEVGFGNGEVLLELASRHREIDFIGAEVHDPGVGRLLIGLQERELSNVRVLHGDAQALMRERIQAEALARILVFFPDPWPKKRHYKRRIINTDNVAVLRRCLGNGGILHLATDWEPYAEHMLEVLENAPGWRNEHADSGFAPGPGMRPQTHFERRGLRLGHGVWDLEFAPV
jgi:tRNA (guanine-N7-)-methyltransferase